MNFKEQLIEKVQKIEEVLREYLPEIVIFADAGFSGSIKVTAVVEEIITKEIEITPEQIQIINIPDKIKGELGEIKENIKIEISAYGSLENEASGDKVNVKADILSYMNENGLTELEPGTYDVQVSFETPEGVWIKEQVKVPVVISTK